MKEVPATAKKAVVCLDISDDWMVRSYSVLPTSSPYSVDHADMWHCQQNSVSLVFADDDTGQDFVVVDAARVEIFAGRFSMC